MINRGTIVIEWFEHRGYGFVKLDCDCKGDVLGENCLPFHDDVFVHIENLQSVSAYSLVTEFDDYPAHVEKLPVPKRGTRVILEVTWNRYDEPRAYRWTYEELWDRTDREIDKFIDKRRAQVAAIA